MVNDVFEDLDDEEDELEANEEVEKGDLSIIVFLQLLLFLTYYYRLLLFPIYFPI